MSPFNVGQRIEACDADFKKRLEMRGYSITGVVVAVHPERAYPVKILMDRSPYPPLSYSKDKQIIAYDLSFRSDGVFDDNKPVIKVIV